MTVSTMLPPEAWALIYGVLALGNLLYWRKPGPERASSIALLGWFALEKVIYQPGIVELGNIFVGLVFALHCFIIFLRYEVRFLLLQVSLGLLVIVWTLLNLGGDALHYKEIKNVGFLVGVLCIWIPFLRLPSSFSWQSSRLYLYCKKSLSDIFTAKLAR